MHRKLAPFYLLLVLVLTACAPRQSGEPTTFNVKIENVGQKYPVLKSGAVAVPVGKSEAGPLLPGDAYEVTFTAPANTLPMSGMRFNFATMFVQSNDFFYAFPPEGLALFKPDGTPLGANGPEDVTDALQLYDAGTEVNEEPGVGPNQKPKQDPVATNVGPAENGVVVLVPDGGQDVKGFSYPLKKDVIEVTIEHTGETEFTVRVMNVSTPNTLQTSEGPKPVPLSPFAYAVHVNSYKLYEVGEPASEGLERIAEDGFPAGPLGTLADDLADVTGVTVPLSPGAYAVHGSGFRLYSVNTEASAGLEAVAEDGIPTVLAESLSNAPAVSASAAFTAADGASEAGAIGPGGSYSFTLEAVPGNHLSFATMFVQSNDLFYGFGEEGLALFSPNGDPVSGDVTAQVALYDAGTEVDEEPGVGPNQVIRQSAPDTGQTESEAVMLVGDGGIHQGYSYPPTEQIIRVTLTPR